MNKFTAAAAIALTLFSGAALAERGSDELNEVAHATSQIQHPTIAERSMTPSDLTAVNGDDAKNAVSHPKSTAQYQSNGGQDIALTELTSRNS
ncbi:hypothetical protein [Vreelandella profundi]|uniref:hypothetical protein n=1 Tax=Vreelandella profundi TaxID=2852117 RepID=UPI001EEFCCC0|nr:hypothetical protein [Halomonas profundi]